MTKLVESGDTELWAVRGADWSLPVYAHPYSGDKQHFYQVTAACPLNNSQFEALDATLSPLSAAPYDNFWLLERSDMEKVASKAPGITPARYVKWAASGSSAPSSIVVRKIDAARGGLNTAFLRHVNAKHSLTDGHAKLRYIWFVLCSEMAQWIHHEQKSIDLGFATLDAVPYRSNWKQVLLSKFPWFMGLMKRFQKKPAFMANLALTEFPSEMRRTDLAAMNKDETPWLSWSLEITPTEAWHQFVRESEQRLATEKGAETYVSYWKTRVDKAEDRSIDIFRSFIEETARPCATIREADNGRHRRLVPLIPAGRVHPVSPDRGADAVVTQNPEEPASRSKEQPVLAHESAALPEVSVIRFEPKELRNSGYDHRN